MAAANTLPIYRTAMKLVQHLHQCTKKAPRELRYTLVQRLMDECVEVCVDAADANRASGAQRARAIERLAGRIVRVEVLTAVALEQRCVSIPAAAIAMEHVESLGRQATGWAKSMKTSVTAAR